MQKNMIGRLMNRKPGDKFIGLALLVCLVVLLLPLLSIARYCIPWYDDYGYGNFVKNFLELDFSLSSAWQGVLYCIKTQWWAWQGTFSSIFFMSLVPIVWNENWYFLGPVFLVLILVIASFVLTKVLVKDVLKGEKWSCLILQSGVAILLVELLYCVREGFYWYNGGVHYVAMHSFLMLYIAAMARLCLKSGKIKTVICLILSLLGALLCAGANYVTALQSLLVVLSVLFFGLITKNKRALLLLPALLLNSYGFYMNASAPGNAKRAAELAGLGMEPVQAVVKSFVEAFHFMWKFTGFMTVFIMLLMLPTVWKLVKKSTYSFRFPGLVLLWSFCLYATGFTPSLYSLGGPGADRTLNAVKITFQLLLIFNQVYISGWICRKLEQNKEKAVWQGSLPLYGYVIICICLLGVFVLTPAREGVYSSWGAFYFQKTGQVQNYYEQYKDRVRIIENGGEDVFVNRYADIPYIMNNGDITENPWYGPNMYMARWYRKNTIRVYSECY